MNRNGRVPLDEARLRPHLRTTQPTTITLTIETTSAFANYTSSIDTSRPNTTLMVDPLELRGIPAIGRGVGGVSPGTQPEQATITKLTKRDAA